MAFCSNCGTELKEGTNFCPSCGAVVNAETKEPAAAGASQANGSAPQYSSQPQASAQPQNSEQQAYSAPLDGAQQNTYNNYYQPNAGKKDFSAKLAGITDTPDSTSEYDPNDISQNKVYAILAYIGILFLVPILGAPKSKFARFHANQGIVLFIAEAALGIVSTIFSLIFGALKTAFMTAHVVANLTGGISFPYVLVSIISVIFTIVFVIIGIFLLFLVIIGIINAAQGKAKEVPLLGKLKILK